MILKLFWDLWIVHQSKIFVILKEIPSSACPGPESLYLILFQFFATNHSNLNFWQIYRYHKLGLTSGLAKRLDVDSAGLVVCEKYQSC